MVTESDVPDFLHRYGPWAVVAGASEGLGACIARRLASRGINLILADLRAEDLRDRAAEIRADYPAVELRTLVGDLTQAATLDAIKALAADVEVGFLGWIAGAASRSAAFLDDELAYARRLIDLNVIGAVDLIHHFGQGMKQRGRGGVMLIGSTCAYAGVPGLAVYSGVKAFLLTLSEALWQEFASHGVDLIGYNLDPMDTPAVRRDFSGIDQYGLEPDAVAEAGLSQLANGPIVYSGMSGDTARMLASMPRADAVRYLVEVAANYGG